MVKALHAPGIEVILDVVYNHTAEGNQLGPDAVLPRHRQRLLLPAARRTIRATTWTSPARGNTLNLQHPRVLQLLMDSLRYWVLEMHVDGFRFDLASALARELHDVDRLGAFFDTIRQDPVLSQVKLIAEPWDIGAGGYQVGNFPPGWNEWNDKYRDTLRALLEGRRRAASASSRAASPARATSTRRAAASRTPASTSSPRTTASRCRTWSATTTSTTRRTAKTTATATTTTARGTAASRVRRTIRPILALRARQKRNLLASLLLSQGVPMMLGGDELGRTQQGNNNAYCQDNEISWFDWDLDERSEEFLEFAARMVSCAGDSIRCSAAAATCSANTMTPEGLKEIIWLTPDGARDDGERLESGFRALPRGVSRRRGDRAARTARQADPGQQLSAALQRAP